MLSIYKKLYRAFTPRERWRGTLVLVLVLVVGLSESVGVASVMPFIAVLANPKVVTTNRYLASVYQWLGFTSRAHFLLFLGVAVFAALVGSLVVKGFGVWAQLRFAQQRMYSWSCRLATGYLNQPYEWFLNHHSAELQANVLAEVNQAVNGVLTRALKAAASTFVVLWLFALLLALDPVLAVTATTAMGTLYGLIAYASRRRLARVGTQRQAMQRARFRVLQEVLGGVKDVKVAGLEINYFRRFATRTQRLADTQIVAGLMGQLPSLAMQGILFGGILLTVLYLMATHGDFEHALPLLTVFAFAGYRMMPALQTIYQSLSQMRFSEAALDTLCEDLESLPGAALPQPVAASERVVLDRAVELHNIEYRYPSAGHPALLGVTIRVPARSTVGLVGSTGSGKTTIVDVVLGLLRPQVGALLVDGTEITDQLVRRWQRSVGYVPQQIFLADDTVEANIALGVPIEQIDRGAIERASRAANLHDFVVNELPQGYSTTVGERGVRLSGGQRQRIGIARALYRDPDLLILDEATSALDNITEQAVMEAVHTLGGTKTIIVIAHRLSTVRSCDCIHLLERGKVVASGKYDQLVAESPEFRALAELA